MWLYKKWLQTVIKLLLLNLGLHMHTDAKNVLIVEDDNVQQIILERLVTGLGHTVLAKVADGAKAIKSALRLRAVDIILMDIRLQDDVDGIQAMQEIRKNSNVKVIYVTGNSDSANLERARETDFVDFIPKPVDPTRLSDAFDKAFNNPA